MLAHSGHVMTLANSIIGVGILAMPFCFLKCGIVLAIILLVVSNWITRLCCHYLIKSSLLTRRKSFEFLSFHAFGPSGKLLVELCIIGYLLGTCITYFVVVGDLGPQIVTKMFSLDDEHSHLRTIFMIAVTVVCILPLGMLKNVDSLSAVCTVSIGFYVCLVVKIILESKEHILAYDWPDKVAYWRPAGVLQCLPIFSMALSCQMQLFEVFSSVHNQSLEKLNGIVRNATWICTFVYISVGFFGYVAFCSQTFSGNILLNFSQSFGSDVIKIGFILSVAFSFPLVIFPCRASIYSLLYRKGFTDAIGYIPEARFKTITIVIVTLALCIALIIPSVELIIGLVGSTIGVAICIMFPASCFRKIVRKESTERVAAQFILVGGFCLMILGTYANLNAIDEKRSGLYLKLANVEPNLSLQPTVMENLLMHNQIELLEQKLKKTELNKKKVEETLPGPEKLALPQQLDKRQLPESPAVVDASRGEEGSLKKQLPVKPSVADNAHYTEGKVNIIVNKVTTAPNSKASLPSLVIDGEAIKKDEDAIAEELKVTKNPVALKNEDELKITQNELKKTKELLERTVGELKEELAKQNKEAQELVVEKLGEVVEKVEEMQLKVQSAVVSAKKPAQSAYNARPIVEQRLSTALINLPDNVSPSATVRTVHQERVYEPLSYKTGELVENAMNGSKLEHRLPLPLALLINAAQAKINGTLAAQTADALASVAAAPVAAKALENPPKLPEITQKAEQTEVAAKKGSIMQVATNERVDQAKEAEKENVEAIRRDILQLDSQQLRDLTTISYDSNYKNSVASQRVKRETETGERTYLVEPKVEVLMAHAMSNAGLDFKLRGMGRDLKAISDDDNS